MHYTHAPHTHLIQSNNIAFITTNNKEHNTIISHPVNKYTTTALRHYRPCYLLLLTCECEFTTSSSGTCAGSLTLLERAQW